MRDLIDLLESVSDPGDIRAGTLTLYHGTNVPYDRIRSSARGSWGPGVYLSPDQSTARLWLRERWDINKQKYNRIEVYKTLNGPIYNEFSLDFASHVEKAFKSQASKTALVNHNYYVNKEESHIDADQINMFCDRHLIQTGFSNNLYMRILRSLGYIGYMAPMDGRREIVIWNSRNLKLVDIIDMSTASWDELW